MENATGQKMIPASFGDPIFDQTRLMEQVGIINSSRIMKIMRNLRKLGPIGEGMLAGRIGERVCYPEWQQFIALLVQWGWVKASLIGHGNSKEISLTALGEQFLADRLDPKPKPQPTE